jgi:GDPmannose 4,6-dehydratase
MSSVGTESAAAPAVPSRAFITGITGQDGGYLAEGLIAAGVEVHGLVHAASGDANDLLARCPSAVLHEGDLADTAAMAGLIREIEPGEIYNLGGISSVAYSWANPITTANITGMGAAGLLDAAWQLQEDTGTAVRVLQASSAEMFGSPKVSPQNEGTPLAPTSPYGAAKVFAHNLVGVYRSRGLYACSMILFNHESPRRPTAFVTRKITQSAAMIAAGRLDVLTLGSLSSRRDWGWAPDYVEAMVRGMRQDHADDYVVATGTSHSVGDFVAAAFARVGIQDWAPLVRTDPAFIRPADAPEQVGDAGKARAQLGWAPTVSFEELVARMVDEDVRQLESRA